MDILLTTTYRGHIVTVGNPHSANSQRGCILYSRWSRSGTETRFLWGWSLPLGSYLICGDLGLYWRIMRRGYCSNWLSVGRVGCRSRLRDNRNWLISTGCRGLEKLVKCGYPPAINPLILVFNLLYREVFLVVLPEDMHALIIVSQSIDC